MCGGQPACRDQTQELPPWQRRLIKVRGISTARQGERTRVHIFICGRMRGFLSILFFFFLHNRRACSVCQVCGFVVHCLENEPNPFVMVPFRKRLMLTVLWEISSHVGLCTIFTVPATKAKYDLLTENFNLIINQHMCVCYNHSAKSHLLPP